MFDQVDVHRIHCFAPPILRHDRCSYTSSLLRTGLHGGAVVSIFLASTSRKRIILDSLVPRDCRGLFATLYATLLSLSKRVL